MKLRNVLNRISIALVLALIVLHLGGCGDSGGMSKQDELKKFLTSSEWGVESITVDGVDRYAVYSDLRIIFADGTFTSEMGEPLWPSSGTWEIIDKEATRLKRNDGVEITILNRDNSMVELGLQWSTTSIEGGRSKSVKGNHVFRLSHF